MKRYILVTGEIPLTEGLKSGEKWDAFLNRVNEAILRGYVPQGGISVTKVSYQSYTTLVQALYLPV